MGGGIEFYAGLLRSLRIELVLLSAVLFVAGLFAAPVVAEREIKLLLRYPLWIWRRIRCWLRPDDPFLKMVVIITCLNGTSLLVNIISGLFIVLPVLFAFLIGLHVGVIVMEETGGLTPLGMLLNPVAFLELPATWISLSLGMEIGLFQLRHFSFWGTLPLLRQGLVIYGTLILPLLLLAALTEVLLIKWGLRISTNHGERGASIDRENGHDASE